MRINDRTPPAVTGPRPAPPAPMATWPAQLYVAVERTSIGYAWDDFEATWDDPEDDYLWDAPVTSDHVDALCSMHGLQIAVGRPDDAGRFAAGELAMTLDNRSGLWAQYDTFGRLTDWLPGRNIDVWATLGQAQPGYLTPTAGTVTTPDPGPLPKRIHIRRQGPIHRHGFCPDTDDRHSAQRWPDLLRPTQPNRFDLHARVVDRPVPASTSIPPDGQWWGASNGEDFYLGASFDGDSGAGTWRMTQHLSLDGSTWNMLDSEHRRPCQPGALGLHTSRDDRCPPAVRPIVSPVASTALSYAPGSTPPPARCCGVSTPPTIPVPAPATPTLVAGPGR